MEKILELRSLMSSSGEKILENLPSRVTESESAVTARVRAGAPISTRVCIFSY
jgi:hypothetical protein